MMAVRKPEQFEQKMVNLSLTTESHPTPQLLILRSKLASTSGCTCQLKPRHDRLRIMSSVHATVHTINLIKRPIHSESFKGILYCLLSCKPASTRSILVVPTLCIPRKKSYLSFHQTSIMSKDDLNILMSSSSWVRDWVAHVVFSQPWVFRFPFQ